MPYVQRFWVLLNPERGGYYTGADPSGNDAVSPRLADAKRYEDDHYGRGKTNPSPGWYWVDGRFACEDLEHE